jgi:hypothetical protein
MIVQLFYCFLSLLYIILRVRKSNSLTKNCEIHEIHAQVSYTLIVFGYTVHHFYYCVPMYVYVEATLSSL